MTQSTTRATFTVTEGNPPKPVAGKSASKLHVDFNPAQLKLTVTNTMQDEQPDGQKSAKKKDSKPPPRQNVRKSATKLETELLFDSTDTGSDVRARGDLLKAMARPMSPKDPALPQVTFRWGLFSFTGVIESISETLDFWSAEGVPLRSTMQLVMQSLELELVGKPEAEDDTTITDANDGLGATGAGGRAGDPRAGRQIAAANGLESMRMTEGGVVAVSDDAEIEPPAAFSPGVSAGLDAGVSAGAAASAGLGGGFAAGGAAGLGASAGFGAGAAAGGGSIFGGGAAAGFAASASAGFGAGASASFGASASGAANVGFGASASAGVSAVAGAFDGLGASKRLLAGVQLDPARLLPVSGTRAIGSGASFDVTGRVITTGSAGLSGNAQAGARVRFM